MNPMSPSPNAPQAGFTRFRYRGAQAQFQVNNVTIMRDGFYDTDSPDEIAALRARASEGVYEVEAKKTAAPDKAKKPKK